MVAMGGSAPCFSHGGAPASKMHGDVDRTMRPVQKPWGIAGNPGVVDRTISFSITERVRLTPESFVAAQGETLKIVLTNNGLLPHEFVIGTRRSFEEHMAMTARDPQRGHGEPYAA